MLSSNLLELPPLPPSVQNRRVANSGIWGRPYPTDDGFGKKPFKYRKPTKKALAMTPDEMFGPMNVLKFQAKSNKAALHDCISKLVELKELEKTNLKFQSRGRNLDPDLTKTLPMVGTNIKNMESKGIQVKRSRLTYARKNYLVTIHKDVLAPGANARVLEYHFKDGQSRRLHFDMVAKDNKTVVRRHSELVKDGTVLVNSEMVSGHSGNVWHYT